MQRIAIIGLGLIGGSIGLALKGANLPDAEIAGTARTRDTLQKAKKMGAIDVGERTAADVVRGARVVIIASPILTIPRILDEIAPVLEEGTVITDCASTKGAVMRWAKEKLPDNVYFVGGHPMAGKESQGIDVAEADLFRGKPWVIVPPVDAPEEAVKSVVALAQLAGAEPVFMDAEEHDSYVAAISHLPLTVASALFSVAFGSAAWPELASLASSGFRDTTRLASSSPEMAHDIMQTNRDNIVHWIDRLMDELYRYRQAIVAGESEPLLKHFTRPQMERDNYVTTGPPRRASGEPLPAVSISDFLFGSKISSMMRKQEEIVKQMEEREKKR